MKKKFFYKFVEEKRSCLKQKTPQCGVFNDFLFVGEEHQ